MTPERLSCWLRRHLAPLAYKLGYLDGYQDAVRALATRRRLIRTAGCRGAGFANDESEG